MKTVDTGGVVSIRNIVEALESLAVSLGRELVLNGDRKYLHLPEQNEHEDHEHGYGAKDVHLTTELSHTTLTSRRVSEPTSLVGLKVFPDDVGGFSRSFKVQVLLVHHLAIVRHKFVYFFRNSVLVFRPVEACTFKSFLGLESNEGSYGGDEFFFVLLELSLELLIDVLQLVKLTTLDEVASLIKSSQQSIIVKGETDFSDVEALLIFIYNPRDFCDPFVYLFNQVVREFTEAVLFFPCPGFTYILTPLCVNLLPVLRPDGLGDVVIDGEVSGSDVVHVPLLEVEY